MSDESPPPAPPRRSRLGLRQLDRRAVGISLLVALIAALAVGLLVSVLTDDDSNSNANGSDSLTLDPAAKVDTKQALSTNVLTFDGKATTLSRQIDGKPAVVNFFSSTCVPCVTEMPALEKVHRRHPDVAFVGIDVQDQVAEGRKLIKRTGITYDALRDPPGDLLRKIGGVGLPTTVLIDANSRVVATHTGALTEQALVSLISAKLR